MRHRRRRLGGLALALCVLTGCTVGEPSGGVSRTSAAPAPPSIQPSDDRYPLTVLRAAVDLSPAVPDGAAVAPAAVAGPDGGAYVLLTMADPDLPAHLATVGPTDGGLGVVRSVAVPRLRPVWGMALLPDGEVLVAGEFRGRGYGFLVVDPASGTARSSVVVPAEDGSHLASGDMSLSSDGETVHLLLRSVVEGRRLTLLFAADAASGRLLGGRDLVEVRTDARVGPDRSWMFARPYGGVTLVVDGYAGDDRASGVPTLLRYDDVLEPVGEPVRMTGPADGARLRAAAATPDGSVYVSVEVPGGRWVLASPPGGSAGTRLLEFPGPGVDRTLAVDPAQGWVLVPAASGARAVNLTTGGSTPVDVGCPARRDVQLLPGRGGASALMLGHCDVPGAGTPMLWITGPGS